MSPNAAAYALQQARLSALLVAISLGTLTLSMDYLNRLISHPHDALTDLFEGTGLLFEYLQSTPPSSRSVVRRCVLMLVSMVMWSLYLPECFRAAYRLLDAWREEKGRHLKSSVRCVPVRWVRVSFCTALPISVSRDVFSLTWWEKM